MEHAARWRSSARDHAALQAGSRRFAMTVARAIELALLVEYETAVQDETAAGASRSWCLRLCRAGIDSIHDHGES